MIKGITFDLWDTVFIDDSDEPKRKAAGRPTKPIERRQIVHQFINKHKSVSLEIVTAVYDAVDAAFRKVWHEQFVTWTVHERLSIILKGLKVELPESEMNELVRLHEEMELEFKPDFIPGVHEAIRSLSKKYKLCVISDTIFSPGRALRELLASEDILQYFAGFVFSDEIGFSKPHPDVFKNAAQLLDLQMNELVHIGDREHNDITGAHEHGLKAVLCTAAIDRDSANTKADGMFSDYGELQKIIDGLS
ncbi:MAG: HAD family hydrolase [Deferribacteres bacterium]|nr:HAD family hydrolase [candidate division KSB1 bacterium]MCB9502009.1 HAD family hydrolase [Deferribacteres bacterium]